MGRCTSTTRHADDLRGADGANELHGRRGGDHLWGRGGDDDLLGAGGHDHCHDDVPETVDPYNCEVFTQDPAPAE